jgi:hypothetical protein
MLIDEAYKTLGKKERNLIKDSENKEKFSQEYEALSSKNHLEALNTENLALVKGIIRRVEKERLYKGKGGEIMRQGVCHLI